jgi:hypothetical protein
MPVNGGLSDRRVPFFKIPQHLMDRNMTIPQGSHIIQNEFSLLGVIASGTPVFHNGDILSWLFVKINMKMGFIFILEDKISGANLL